MQSLSDDFMRRAKRAEDRMGDCKRRVPYSPGHKWAYDDALAEFYVYKFLHGRTFLNSPEELLAELRAMKTVDFKTDSSAYDKERFEYWRLILIDDLLQQTEQAQIKDTGP